MTQRNTQETAPKSKKFYQKSALDIFLKNIYSKNITIMATKLHELLAAEGNLETQAIQTRTDLANTFEKKRHLFEEKRTLFTPSEEGKAPVLEAQSDIQSTVKKELEWITPHLVKALDASYQVAETNTNARADVVLDDDAATVIAKGVPATALLELEKRLNEWVLQLVKGVPTLDPAKGFQPDTQRDVGIFKAREVNKTRTRKDAKPIVLYAATKEHPAQTQLINVDVPIGNISEQEWSGLITPAEKSEMLNRAEQLIRAVRKARSRANDAEVDPTKRIGKRLIGYVFQGKVL
jgi:hypothetical protein